MNLGSEINRNNLKPTFNGIGIHMIYEYARYIN